MDRCQPLWPLSNLPYILAPPLLRFMVVPQKLLVMFYFFSVDWEHLKTQMPGVFSSISECWAGTESIVNGFQFHTWFVQAHWISSLLFKCKYLGGVFVGSIYSFATSAMISEFTFEQLGFRICKMNEESCVSIQTCENMCL